MIKLLTIFAIALLLAHCSQKGILVFNLENGRKIDLPLIIMILMLSFFCGLRTNYNDTAVYIASYKNAPSVREFLDKGIDIFSYPAFYGLQSVLRHHVSSNANVFLLINALFSIGSIVTFLKRHTNNFVLSMILFFSLGLYMSHFAAMKQCIAIAVLTYAVEALIKNKKFLFVFLVFVAMLFHTYAILALVLIVFTNKPWSFFTYVSIAAIVLFLLTFESTLTSLLDYADEFGKSYTSKDVLESESINPFRLAIFAVPPIISFLLQEFVQDEYSREKCILMNMCILTFLIMSLGIGSSANLFARCSFYFEVGTMVAFPWFLNQVFDKSTERLVSVAASAGYIAFFIISNTNFSTEYRAVDFIEFITNIF